MNTLYKAIMDKVHEKTNSDLKSTFKSRVKWARKFSLFRHTERYLSEIAEQQKYDVSAVSQEQVAQNYMEFSKR
jgi:methylmalonyl-CoA mutase